MREVRVLRLKRRNGFTTLGAIVAAVIVLGTALLAGSSLSNMSRLSGKIASRNAYMELERGILSTVAMTVADYLSIPNNCSCAANFITSLDGQTIGQDVVLKWMRPDRIQQLLANPRLPPEQAAALQRCQSPTTNNSGFLDDPNYQVGGQDCSILPVGTAFQPTNNYVPPQGPYFCMEIAPAPNSPAPPQGSMLDSDPTLAVFAEMRFQMLDSMHSQSVADCRSGTSVMMTPLKGGVVWRVLAAFYWTKKVSSGGQPFRHVVDFSLPVDQDPLWRYIERLYGDVLSRAGSFEEVFYWWDWAHTQETNGASLTSVRSQLAHNIIYSQESGADLIRNWGYNLWLGQASGFGNQCSGDLASHRGNLEHVWISQNGNGTCNDNGWLNPDLYAQWDYALVFGRDIGAGTAVWAKNGGNSCYDIPSSGNLDPSSQAGCDATCASVITQMYQNLLGRPPTATPSSAASDANAYWQQCRQGPWMWDNVQNRFVGGSQVWEVGYNIAQSLAGSEYIVTQLYKQFLRRAPTAAELANVADSQLNSGGQRILDLMVNLAQSDEYYALRP